MFDVCVRASQPDTPGTPEPGCTWDGSPELPGGSTELHFLLVILCPQLFHLLYLRLNHFGIIFNNPHSERKNRNAFVCLSQPI